MTRSFFRPAVMAFVVLAVVVASGMVAPCTVHLGDPPEGCHPDIPTHTHGNISHTDRPGYEFPDNLDIERLQIADGRVQYGEGIRVEVNVTNTGDVLIVFEPPLFVYYETEEILLDVDMHTLTIFVFPGETVHEEFLICTPERPGEYLIGADYEHERFPIGQAEVYKNSTQNVSTTATSR